MWDIVYGTTWNMLCWRLRPFNVIYANLRYKYCFYQEETELLDVISNGNMSLDTLSNVVKKIRQSEDCECAFVFQGGEPALQGLPFYKELIHLQQPYRE